MLQTMSFWTLKIVLICVHTLKQFYFVNVHSPLRYGIIFCGSSHDFESICICFQKRITRTITGFGPSSSCRQLFRNYKMLPSPCLYVYELLVFRWKLISRVAKQRHLNEINCKNALTRVSYLSVCKNNLIYKFIANNSLHFNL